MSQRETKDDPEGEDRVPPDADERQRQADASEAQVEPVQQHLEKPRRKRVVKDSPPTN